MCNKLGEVFPAATGAFEAFLGPLEHATSENDPTSVNSNVFCMSVQKNKYGISSTTDYDHKNRIGILSEIVVSAGPYLVSDEHFGGNLQNHRAMATMSTQKYQGWDLGAKYLIA